MIDNHQACDLHIVVKIQSCSLCCYPSKLVFDSWTWILCSVNAISLVNNCSDSASHLQPGMINRVYPNIAKTTDFSEISNRHMPLLQCHIGIHSFGRWHHQFIIWLVLMLCIHLSIPRLYLLEIFKIRQFWPLAS